MKRVMPYLTATALVPFILILAIAFYAQSCSTANYRYRWIETQHQVRVARNARDHMLSRALAAEVTARRLRARLEVRAGG